MKVRVIQADNRPILYYIELTKKVNECACNNLSYNYTFVQIPPQYTSRMHPAATKILVVNDYLQTATDDILIFLDSDAWIHNEKHLDKIVKQLAKDPSKHGCYSRDTYVKKNTYINSGAFILKVDGYSRNMYRDLVEELSVNSRHHNAWPFDQYYISKFVYEHRTDFIIYKPEVFNTPVGIVLRHNWNKNEKMYVDLHEAVNNQEYTSSPVKFLDDQEFPNKIDGVDYMQRFPQLNAP